MIHKNLILTQNIYDNLLEQKQNLYEIIKNAIIMESYNKMTIYNTNWNDIVSLIILLTEVPHFKEQMLKEIQSSNKLQKGIELEQQILLGYIISFTMIPNPNDPRMKEMTEKAVMKIRSCKY